MYKINVSGVINELKEDLGKAINETQVIEIKNHYLKVKLNPLYGELKNMPANEKGPFGKDINDFKLRINEVCDEKFNSVKLENEKKNHKVDYDITVETSNFNKGSLSPITLVFNQILEYFEMLNFTIQSGEEVMSSKYNFDNLNIPATHPTREPSETFYVSDKVSLRTQNTASSAQYIENNFDDEIRIANFGYVYRNDDDDSTHSHQFNQIDFIWIKDSLNVKNLKWMINGLLRHIFGPNTKTRFRLSNFPFTEPSFEVDASCPFCGGNGCHRCKQSGWIELLGCGIVHEKVLNVSNITDKIGLAAGFGVERIAMIKYGIEDVRDIYNNDFRFSTQFRKESK